MVYINLRLNVADYDKWRAAFEGFESYRKELGSTGVNQIFHDVHDPDNVTLIMEWDEATNAKAFLNNPQTKANMDAAGVTGRPMVVAGVTSSISVLPFRSPSGILCKERVMPRPLL